MENELYRKETQTLRGLTLQKGDKVSFVEFFNGDYQMATMPVVEKCEDDYYKLQDSKYRKMISVFEIQKVTRGSETIFERS